jgi:hypothetical protein
VRTIDPLVTQGEYVEQHERWYLLPGDLRWSPVPALAAVNAGDAHARFVRRWAETVRAEDARLRRDAREQFIARLETTR